MGWTSTMGLRLRLPLNAIPLSLNQLIVLCLVMVLLMPPRVESFGVCRSSFRCLNGGEERYGQSIFGPCRCRCPHGYTGPRCQYREALRKRSSSLNVLNDFLRARLRAERLHQQQEQELQQQQEEAFISSEQDVLPMHRRRRSWLGLHPRFFRR